MQKVRALQREHSALGQSPLTRSTKSHLSSDLAATQESSPKAASCAIHFMDADQENAADCSVCLQPLFDDSQSALGALQCGHLYHAPCIHQWLASKDAQGTCCVCKAFTDATKVRVLKMEAGSFVSAGTQEVEQLKASTAEERRELLQDLQRQHQEQRDERNQVSAQMDRANADKQEYKRQRKELERRLPEIEEMTRQLKASHQKYRSDNENLQAHLTKEEERHYTQFPVKPAQNEDADFKEEQKILQAARDGGKSRARKLHESLLHERQLEADASLAGAKVLAEAQEREEEARRLRLRHAERDEVLTSQGRDDIAPQPQAAPRGPLASRAERPAQTRPAAPPAIQAGPPQTEPEEDLDDLFGGPPRPKTKGLLARAGGQSWAGGPKASSSSSSQLTQQAKRTPSGIRKLFANQQGV